MCYSVHLTIVSFFSVCTTISGPSTNQRCILPFKFNGVTHQKCPTDPEDKTKHWCSTKVDQNGQHISGIGAYGNCGPNCPLVSEVIRSRSSKSNNSKNRKTTRRRSSKLWFAKKCFFDKIL